MSAPRLREPQPPPALIRARRTPRHEARRPCAARQPPGLRPRFVVAWARPWPGGGGVSSSRRNARYHGSTGTAGRAVRAGAGVGAGSPCAARKRIRRSRREGESRHREGRVLQRGRFLEFNRLELFRGEGRESLLDRRAEKALAVDDSPRLAPLPACVPLPRSRAGSARAPRRPRSTDPAPPGRPRRRFDPSQHRAHRPGWIRPPLHRSRPPMAATSPAPLPPTVLLRHHAGYRLRFCGGHSVGRDHGGYRCASAAAIRSARCRSRSDSRRGYRRFCAALRSAAIAARAPIRPRWPTRARLRSRQLPRGPLTNWIGHAGSARRGTSDRRAVVGPASRNKAGRSHANRGLQSRPRHADRTRRRLESPDTGRRQLAQAGPACRNDDPQAPQSGPCSSDSSHPAP